jgi:hypothetical protein
LRKLIVAVSALALAVPAAAQPRHHPSDDEVARRLPPPGEIEEVGDALGRVADAVMDVDVGPIADAVDPGRRPHRETIGDLASRDDPYARERIQDSIARSTIGLRVALDQVAILTPALRRSIEDAERRIDDAMRDRDYRRGRDWDRDRDRDRDWDRDRDDDRDPEGR